MKIITGDNKKASPVSNPVCQSYSLLHTMRWSRSEHLIFNNAELDGATITVFNRMGDKFSILLLLSPLLIHYIAYLGQVTLAFLAPTVLLLEVWEQCYGLMILYFRRHFIAIRTRNNLQSKLQVWQREESLKSEVGYQSRISTNNLLLNQLLLSRYFFDYAFNLWGFLHSQDGS